MHRYVPYQKHPAALHHPVQMAVELVQPEFPDVKTTLEGEENDQAGQDAGAICGYWVLSCGLQRDF